MLARLRELNWQPSGKKNAPIWEEDFVFHIFNMAQINKRNAGVLQATQNLLRLWLLGKRQRTADYKYCCNLILRI